MEECHNFCKQRDLVLPQLYTQEDRQSVLPTGTLSINTANDVFVVTAARLRGDSFGGSFLHGDFKLAL